MVLKVPVTKEDHIQRNPDAILTLVEYGDYECPYCRRAYGVIKQVQKHFGDKLNFVYRNFPLAEVHAFAEPAAETAELAAKFDHFWEMHDLIYEESNPLSLPVLLQLGEKLKLSQPELEQAIENKTFKEKIRQDFMGGVKSGVNGTPTFFINEQRYNGHPDNLIATIEAILKEYEQQE